MYVIIYMGNFCNSKQLYQSNPTHAHKIYDKYHSFIELQQDLRRAGMEASQLIFAVDFTGSNKYSGNKTLGCPMHTLCLQYGNYYERVINAIGMTLEPFDDDHLIPAYGFGQQQDQLHSYIFNINKRGTPCVGFLDVLQQYRNTVLSGILMSGPTTIAPIINEAINIVKSTGQFHILVIITDGQLDNKLMDAEAIVRASHYPLSIITIGVGDGPWDVMHEFDDELPDRLFDNFQFVDFNSIEAACVEDHNIFFATNAMMEVPEQYKEIKRLGLFSNAHL